MKKWKSQRLKTSTEPVKNDDLWRALGCGDGSGHKMQWRWVRGHSDHVENERAMRWRAVDTGEMNLCTPPLWRVRKIATRFFGAGRSRN